MKQRFTKGIVTGALLLASAGVSFAQFTLDGQYRPRVEFRNGFKKPILESQDPAAFVEHRARLTAGYSKEKLGFKLSVQDVRVWGETGQINKSDQLLSVHEAYGDFKPSAVSTFRIGRQELAYDGHRFIGTLNWAAQARAFDALRYMYKNDSTGLSFDAAIMFNQDGGSVGAPEPAKLTGTQYTTGGGKQPTTIFNLPLPKAQQLFYIKKKFKSGDVALMALNDIHQDVATAKHYNNQHFGLTPNYKVGDIKLGGQFYYSMGDAGIDAAGEKVDLSGYMFNLTVQHTKLPGKPLLGIDYISGDDASTTDKVEAWTPKYGTNHKFYGFMDYFYVGNGHGTNGNGGLIDLYLKTTFKTGEKSKILAHLHGFMSPTDVADPLSTDPNATQSSYLGTELDIVYVNKLAEGITLKAGYSHMFTTDAMQAVKGQFGNETAGEYDSASSIQNWAWVMIDFTPKFLNK